MAVILNFSDQTLQVKTGLTQKYHKINNFIDVYSGNSFKAKSLDALEIKPYGFYMLKPEQGR